MGQQADQQTMVLLRRVLRNPARPGHLPWVKYEYGKRPAACYKPNVRRDSCESSQCDTVTEFPGAIPHSHLPRDGAAGKSISSTSCPSALAAAPSPISQMPSTLSQAPCTRHPVTGAPEVTLSTATPDTAPGCPKQFAVHRTNDCRFPGHSLPGSLLLH